MNSWYFCLHLPSTRIRGIHHCTHFYAVLGGQTQDFMHAGQVLYKLSDTSSPVCVPLAMLSFKSHQMLRAQGCWNAGTRWFEAQCPQVTGLGTSSESYCSLSSDFPFSGKSRYSWSCEPVLGSWARPKICPSFCLFFFLHEGDYTIAGLGSGILAKWSFGFSQVYCLLQLVWLILLQTRGFLCLCFQVLLQTPHFSRRRALWVTPVFGVKQLVHRDRVWFFFKGFKTVNQGQWVAPEQSWEGSRHGSTQA